MSLIEIYEASLTGKVKVNYQYKASKIGYTKGRVPKKKKAEKVWSFAKLGEGGVSEGKQKTKHQGHSSSFWFCPLFCPLIHFPMYFALKFCPCPCPLFCPEHEGKKEGKGNGKI